MVTMHVHTAQLAGGAHNADRVFLTDRAVIVLDGASAFVPVDVDPATYAQTLGEHIARRLTADGEADLSTVVAAAISATAAELHLTPSASPSSTVSILRTRPDAADLYVLGDSPIHYGSTTTADVFTDERLSAIATDERARYRDRLRAGNGYDDEHRAALVTLQRAQQAARNRVGGYWIAEADPDAAHHGLTATLPRSAIVWAVLATDGAADYIDHAGLDWRAIADQDADQLAALLERATVWETTTDPDGQELPRAKRHDDKTVAAIPAVW